MGNVAEAPKKAVEATVKLTSNLVKGVTGIKTPKMPDSAVQETALVDEKDKAKKMRAKLVATSGGVLGEELQAGQVKTRSTLLGN